jgi:hypothetical protein
MGRLLDLLDISLERANQFYTWGWRLSAMGATVTLLGVALLWWGTRVRDRDFGTSIADLHTRAAASENASEQLRQANLKLQQQLEREKTERVKMEAALAWRRISKEQAEIIAASIKASGLQPGVYRMATDPEAATFTEDIIATLRLSGYEPQWGGMMAMSGSPPMGLGVRGPAKEQRDVIIAAFAKADILMGDAESSDKLEILIGTKPPAF